jgi:hypothetical protein
MPLPTPKPKRRTGLVVWLVVSQVLTVISLFLWSIAAGLGYALINSNGDAPSAVLIALWAYPIYPLTLIIGAWIAFRRRKDKRAAILSGLSFAPPALFMLVMWIRSMLGVG